MGAHIVTAVNVDDDGCNGPSTHIINLVIEARPSNIGYIIYTIGTTGNPNLFMLNHKSDVEMIQLD